VARFFLAVWLGAFTLQTTDVLIVLAADDCSESTKGSAGDPCPENCSRCICCARVATFIHTALASAPADVPVTRATARPIDVPRDPAPHGIFHVPKDSLT
jgi:hypothetical protein